MRNSARYTSVLLIVSFAFANGAFAIMEEEEDASPFVRTGFYLGVGGTAGFPHGWNSDFDGELDGEASDRANANAQFVLDPNVPPAERIIPLSLRVDGADLEGAMFGVNGVVGYRAGALAAFEIEGEWLSTSNETDLDITGSTGSHGAEVGEIWVVTANVKMFPPFDGWLRPLERFQPFAKFGLGVQHSRLEVDIESSGLSTTNLAETVVVPADFQIRQDKTKIDGALRVGGGIDIYATRNLVSEINATYVVPFSDVGFLTTDYVSVQWRLVYRF